MSSLIKLEHVTKVYQLSDNNYTALKDVNLEIQRGEMMAVMGASGSGKSTLMNIIGFLDCCTSGNYFFSGENVSRLSEEALAKIRNQKIGFVFQSFFLLPRLNALQNVMLPLFYRGSSRDESQLRAREMLARVNMAAFSDHRPSQLSGGQQQRIAIARALVTNPEIILADEPTGALDSKTSQEVMQLLINLHRQEGRTIAIITHDKEVSAMCQRTVFIKDGMV